MQREGFDLIAGNDLLLLAAVAFERELACFDGDCLRVADGYLEIDLLIGADFEMHVFGDGIDEAMVGRYDAIGACVQSGDIVFAVFVGDAADGNVGVYVCCCHGRTGHHRAGCVGDSSDE